MKLQWAPLQPRCPSAQETLKYQFNSGRCCGFRENHERSDGDPSVRRPCQELECTSRATVNEKASPRKANARAEDATMVHE